MVCNSWLIALFAYLIGSFPTGVVLSRRKFGIDVRDIGSGNIGATNITRNFGWRAGFATFFIDFMKGYLGLQLAEAFGGGCPWSVTAAGAAVVAGHCFSVFLGFRGGKGVATTLGCLVNAVPAAGLLMACAYLISLWITRISAVGSLVGVLLAVAYVCVLPGSAQYTWMVLFMAIIVLVRHESNIRRLFLKT